MYRYESDELTKAYHGDNLPSGILYESEIEKEIIMSVKGNYPQLIDYEREWIKFALYIYEAGTPVELEYETVELNPTNTVYNAIPFSYKGAILKGNTKYRDIDTGDILDTFDETKNLELVSVKMPVLTTTNADANKTNILTVNEPVELHGIGDVKDELNLLTGELTQRVCEIVLDGSEDWVGEDERFRLYKDNIIPDKWTDGISNHFIGKRGKLMTAVDYDNYFVINGHGSYLYVRDINLFPNPKSQLNEFKSWLSERNVQGNPVVLQYCLSQASIKTVDLSSNIKPYEGTNHYEVSSQTIPPIGTLQVPVVSTGAKTLYDIQNEG